VQRVTDIIGEITAAANEQSSGIDQINVAVTQLDQMTQQNAALVEESAAAAESLKHQAVNLAEVVGVFQVGESGEAEAAIARARESARQGPPRAAALGSASPARGARAGGVASQRGAGTPGRSEAGARRGASTPKPSHAGAAGTKLPAAVAPAAAVRAQAGGTTPGATARDGAAQPAKAAAADDGWETF